MTTETSSRPKLSLSRSTDSAQSAYITPPCTKFSTLEIGVIYRNGLNRPIMISHELPQSHYLAKIGYRFLASNGTCYLSDGRRSPFEGPTPFDLFSVY